MCGIMGIILGKCCKITWIYRRNICNIEILGKGYAKIVRRFVCALRMLFAIVCSQMARLDK